MSRTAFSYEPFYAAMKTSAGVVWAQDEPVTATEEERERERLDDHGVEPVCESGAGRLSSQVKSSLIINSPAKVAE